MTGTEITIVITAFTLGAMVKSITGMGLPLVAVPIMTLFMPTETAVAVVAIPNAVQNLALVISHRSARSSTRNLLAFCAVGVGGAALGAISLSHVDEWILQLALVVMVAAYLISAVLHPNFEITSAVERWWTAPVAFVGGIFQGAIGISGPVVATWHHGLRLTQNAFVFSIASVFLITGTTQVSVLAFQGKLDGRLLVSLLLIVIVMVTVPIGRRLRDRLPIETFRRLILLLLAVSGTGIAADLLRQALR